MISFACALIVSAPFPVDIKLGDVTSTATSFELPVVRGALAVNNAKTVHQANGDTLYFVNNGSGVDSDIDYATGPIAHLRTRDMPRGFAILLTPRGETSVKAEGGMIVASAKPTTEARAPIAEGRLPKADVRAPIAEDRLPKADVRAPIAEDRLPKADVRAPIAEDRLPKADVRAPSADSRAAEQAAPVMARAASARASAQPIQDSGSSPSRTFGLLAVLLAVAAAVIVYGKKKKIPNQETAGIDVIAVKSLGSKQRLAVVDACGDRMLIATSEHGVQLLSKLEGGTGIHKLAPDFLASLQQAEASNAQPTTHVTQVNTSKDLAGLVSLRARRATWTSSDVH